MPCDVIQNGKGREEGKNTSKEREGTKGISNLSFLSFLNDAIWHLDLFPQIIQTREFKKYDFIFKKNLLKVALIAAKKIIFPYRLVYDACS